MADKNNKLNGGTPHTLEDRIVVALQDPGIAATEIAELIKDCDQGLIDAAKIAERMQEIALDPLQSPDPAKAKEAAEFATFVIKRLNNALPRLRTKHQQLTAQQRTARWNTLADVTQANRDTSPS
jgi:hypothetical protein